MSAVEEIVAKYEGQIQASTIWFKPNIPSDILEKVLAQKKGTLISPDSVLLLVDDSKKTGFFLNQFKNYLVLTEDKIINFGTYAGGDSGTIGFTNFQNAELEDNGGGVYIIHFDGEPLIGLWMMGQQVGSEICNLLNEIAKKLAPKSVGNSADDEAGNVKCDEELEDCYRVLDLESTASLDEVKQSWRELAKLYHPDRLQHDPKLQLRGQEKLKNLNAAYDMLVRHLTGQP
jgi:DnaJ domain